MRFLYQKYLFLLIISLLHMVADWCGGVVGNHYGLVAWIEWGGISPIAFSAAKVRIFSDTDIAGLQKSPSQAPQAVPGWGKGVGRRAVTA
ncbi:MAG: hypothetical protein IJ789_00050 [Bacteroidales bacterium]|nr:hypothetical protein [Bacteroidales bacterium]